MMASGSSAFDTLIQRGVAAMEIDDAASAHGLFLQALAERPDAALPHFLVGSQYAASGDFSQAEAFFATAVLLAPDFAIARYQLGLLQFTSQRVAIALLTWQPLLTLPSREPLAHFVRGFEALADDRFDEALGHFKEGLALHPENRSVAGDIEKVIAGIHPLDHGAVSAGDATPTRSEQDTHVLLANYQQQGRAH